MSQVALSTPIVNPVFTLGTDGSGGTVLAVVSQNDFVGTYTSGIVLSNPATQNPTTVAATGYVTNTTTAHNGDAVYGTNAAPWNFTNLGTLTATGVNSNGVHLIGRNASDTKPAKFLVLLVKDKGAPILVPVNK